MDFFKKLFNFPSRQHPGESERAGPSYPPGPFEDNLTRFFNNFKEDSISHHFQQQIGTFFDKEMEEILKTFAVPPFGNFLEPSLVPSLEPLPQEPHNPPPDSRDHYLKPNFQNEKIDQDLDGKLNASDLDQFLKNPPQPKIFTNKFFNQSVSMRTIRNPDGSIETQKTVTDSDGNQETIVTKKQGEKEYTIVKRRDREGKEEVHENLVNMNEDERFLFGLDKKKSDFFDKFFK